MHILNNEDNFTLHIGNMSVIKIYKQTLYYYSVPGFMLLKIQCKVFIMSVIFYVVYVLYMYFNFNY